MTMLTLLHDNPQGKTAPTPAVSIPKLAISHMPSCLTMSSSTPWINFNRSNCNTVHHLRLCVFFTLSLCLLISCNEAFKYSIDSENQIHRFNLYITLRQLTHIWNSALQRNVLISYVNSNSSALYLGVD